VHTVAPSSIMAWLKSPGRRGGTSAPASAQSRPSVAAWPMGAAMSNKRASTRLTFPSSTGTASLYAMLAMAPAVYRPMPGRACHSSAVSGNCPPRSEATRRAARCRLRARA